MVDDDIHDDDDIYKLFKSDFLRQLFGLDTQSRDIYNDTLIDRYKDQDK